MSVRPHRMRRKLVMAATSGRFYVDRQGRLRRTCRCEYCTPVYRRPPPGHLDSANRKAPA